MRPVIKSRVASIAALAAVLLLPLSAGAQPGFDGRAVFFEGPVVLGGDQRVASLVAFEGPTQVNGVVANDVVAIDGDVGVAGQVGGDVIAMSGAVRLGPSAVVGGDVVAPRAPVVAEGARIGGVVRPFGAEGDAEGAGVLGYFLSWLGMIALAAVVALLLHFFVPERAKKVAYRTARADPWKSVGVGVLLAVGLPFLGFVALMTVIGIPVGIALFLLAALVAFAGFVIGGFILGGAIAERSRRGASWSPLAWAFVGVGILCALTLVPVLGTIVWIAASLYGAGAAALAGWNARRARRAPTTRSPEPRPTTTAEQQHAGA